MKVKRLWKDLISALINILALKNWEYHNNTMSTDKLEKLPSFHLKNFPKFLKKVPANSIPSKNQAHKTIPLGCVGKFSQSRKHPLDKSIGHSKPVDRS